ncbi:hypothetical protein LSAT2_019783 [Lamellibrachia satsuma]|nr:hypothetical protein LSAT2_019783 [Lamellibrachia satsuma]
MHPTAIAAMAEDKGKVAASGEFKYIESAPAYAFKLATKDIVKVGTVSMFNFPDQENSYNCSRRLLYIIV